MDFEVVVRWENGDGLIEGFIVEIFFRDGGKNFDRFFLYYFDGLIVIWLHCRRVLF